MKRLLTVCLALLLCAGMATPAWAATGYGHGSWDWDHNRPWRPNYPKPTYVVYVPYSYYSTSAYGHGYRTPYYRRDSSRDRDTRRKTTIRDRDLVPLTVHPFTTTITSTTKLKASQIKKKSDGSFEPITNVAVVTAKAVAGVDGTLLFDYKDGKKVVGRVYVNAKAVKNAINVTLTTDAKYTSRPKKLFQKYGKGGNFAVVTMGQQGAFGMTVRVAIAKSQLGKVNTQKMAVLVYNRSTNTYIRLKKDQIKIQGGYVYLSVKRGGDIIFTDDAKYVK